MASDWRPYEAPLDAELKRVLAAAVLYPHNWDTIVQQLVDVTKP